MRIPEAGDTIVALSTAPGTGAIAVIRLSGPEALAFVDAMFIPSRKGVTLLEAEGNTAHFGRIMDGENVLDEVVVTVFRAPHSYTGEDVAEISCHGSPYIQQRLLELLTSRGIRQAGPGEFTLRAFRNGKMDLSQAEAVADLVASQTRASHDLALQQMRGGYSDRIGRLRKELVDFTALVELELDFSEEDVQFADRSALAATLQKLKQELGELEKSFSMGNVLKQGIPVAIIGKPNVGKSTLLNAILNEERAIVSDIPGTTRDAIEDTIVMEGIPFRFIDTAGLRESADIVEGLGMERTKEKIAQAQIILCVFDISETDWDELREMHEQCQSDLDLGRKHVIMVGNKTDKLAETPRHFRDLVEWETVFVSAKRKENIHMLAQSLLRVVDMESISDRTLVSNTRHVEALARALQALERVHEGMDQALTSDLLTSDIRDALYHLGTITGEITNEEILGSIFSRFCIGK